MPTDGEMWAAIVLSGFFILVSYYVVVWARSVRKQLGRVSDSCGVLESRLAGLRSEVGALTRELSGKVNNAQLDAYCTSFTSPGSRKVKMVMKRG